jgi:hypothetical protein
MRFPHRFDSVLGIALVTVASTLAFPLPSQALTYNCYTVGAEQAYLYFGNESGNNGYESYSYMGITYGIEDIAEIGGCWVVDGGHMLESPVFDAKVRISLDDETGTAFALGFENASSDEDKNGSYVPYAVYTYDFGSLRGHAGYAFERDNEGIFFGIDGDVDETCLGVDWRQMDEGSEWESTINIYAPLEFIDESCALFAYYTFSSDSEESDTLTVEISYTIG